MKKLLIVAVTVLFCIKGFPQKKTVAITSFETTSSNISVKYIKAIEDKVKEAFYSTNRFYIVDRTNYKKIKEEKEIQKGEGFMDGRTVGQTSLEGAEQIVTGSISQIDIIKKYTEESNYYECEISFSLQVLDVATGQVLAIELIRPRQTKLGSFVSASLGEAETPEKAFYNALKGTQKEINKFVDKHFPVITLIIEISEASSNKAKILLISTGNINGAKKNQKFQVVELVNMKVGDKEIVRKKEIGEIKIIKVEGEEISVAKVIKGGGAILSKFNAGAKIECYSKN